MGASERVTFEDLKGDISSTEPTTEEAREGANIPASRHVPHVRASNHTNQREYSSSFSSSSEDASTGEAQGASAPAVAEVTSLICSRIAKAAKLAAPATSLANLVKKYAHLGDDELVLQAELAAAWLADPAKNKGGKRAMNILFLHNWLSKAQTPPPSQSLPMAAGQNPQQTYWRPPRREMPTASHAPTDPFA